MPAPEHRRTRELDWVDPVLALRAAEGMPGRVLLDSGGPAGPRARWSVLAVQPLEVIEGRVGLGLAGGALACDPFAQLGALHARWSSRARGSDVADQSRTTARPGSSEAMDAGQSVCAPFTGGVIALLGYDCGRVLERLPATALDDPLIPDLWAAAYDGALVFDRLNQRLIAFSHGLEGDRTFERFVSIRDSAAGLTKGRGAIESLAPHSASERTAVDDSFTSADVAGLRGPAAATEGADFTETAPVQASRIANGSADDRARFLDGVASIRELIARGEIYQANLTRRFVKEARGRNSLQIYERLRALSPTPFAAFVDAGAFQVLSASPERFVRMHEGVVETRPIKGTRRRGRDVVEDASLRADLLSSAKDAAELLMIVDLERNDLGRVSRVGTVEVLDFPSVETYSTVSHLVATVRGRVRSGTGPEMVLRAAFPGGSITGAPKVRAMEILEALEPHRRKFAMGSLVAWDHDGSFDSSILIRTIVVRGRQAIFNVGSGIVTDSVPEEELRETDAKAAPLVAALEAL